MTNPYATDAARVLCGFLVGRFTLGGLYRTTSVDPPEAVLIVADIRGEAKFRVTVEQIGDAPRD